MLFLKKEKLKTYKVRFLKNIKSAKEFRYKNNCEIPIKILRKTEI